MKVAFSSSGNDLESQLDPRFGRCPKFLIVDLDNMDIEVYENDNAAMGGGAGIQTAQFLASKGVTAVITGRCGPNAVQTLNAAGIKLYTGQDGIIRDLIDPFQNGKMTPITKANAQAHAGTEGRGMGGVSRHGRWPWHGWPHMIVSIASGKGGTGKTTVAANLAMSVNTDVQLLDCDVEEPNAYLFIHPIFDHSATVSVPVPEIDTERCTLCGECSDLCQFKAIAVIPDMSILTFPELCHSCGGCWAVCPENAISEGVREIGVLESGCSDRVSFIHGRMRIGEAMAPPLIQQVRRKADPNKLTIIDAPPGTSCPVISAIRGADVVLLVTEPTPFGLHDLKLAHAAVRSLGIPSGLVVNRVGIGDDAVFEYADTEGLPVLMKIPFDRRIAETYARGQLLIEELPEYKARFR